MINVNVNILNLPKIDIFYKRQEECSTCVESLVKNVNE